MEQMTKTFDIPGYDLGQEFIIASMGYNIPVKVTRRCAKFDIDGTGIVYLYDLIHTDKVDKPWTWPEVSESNLREIIREAERNGRKLIGR